MKGKIDKDGTLYIERKGKYKCQCCPIPEIKGMEGVVSGCGDWCPLFGEPVATTTEHYPDDDYITLTICNNRTLIFDEFTDERAI